LPRCLFVSQRVATGVSGARVGSDRNLFFCQDAFGKENTTLYKIQKGRISHLARKLLQFFGYVDGMLPRDVKAIVEEARSGKYDLVFFDSSYFGLAVKAVAKKAPGQKIVVFYHDIIVDWWRSTKNGPAYRQLFWSLVYRRVERLSTVFANERIFLTERDRETLRKEYGAEGGPIIPVTLVDRFDEGRRTRAAAVRKAEDRILLFVGVDYKPNTDGIAWFLANVLPYIKSRVKIVGLDLENYRSTWTSPRVEVVGTVDDVDEYYYGADAVVIPLFSGGGMKIKTAESLMFGKTVFGTPEGFVGYELPFGRVGAVCGTAEDFIAAIRAWESDASATNYNEASRAAFLQGYSYEVSLAKARKIFGVS
jgi:glycosyltransferase involved in cell wall biosynthesis